jgi:hypothetical protein
MQTRVLLKCVFHSDSQKRNGPGCKNGIRRRDIKEPPHLRIERKTASSSGGQHKREKRRLKGMNKYNDIYWRTTGLKFVKRANGTSSGLQKGRKWILCRGRPPPKRKKKLHTESEPEMWEHRPLD